jgi:Na+/melibiose symporter-like transporter
LEAITPAPGLWRNSDFLKLWVGQTITQIGSQVSFLAFPLIAVTVLDATPAQMAVLTAVGALPALVVGLHAGALVDRHRRRPILIATDLGRAALLCLIPLAWAFDALTVPLLYAVALASGLLGLFFDLAYQAFLPAVVPRARLVEGNAKLEMSRTAAELAGPGLAGGLLQLLSAPLTLLLDAGSYLVSGVMFAWIRVKEPAPLRATGAARFRSEIREGLSLVAREPRLRALAGCGLFIGLFNAALEVVFVLYIVRVLGVGPAVIGIVFAVGSGGFLLGALLPERISRWIGYGPAMVAGVATLAIGDLLVPLAEGSRWVIVPMLMAAQFLFGVGLTLFKVNQASLRQAIVPGHLRGRASGTVRVLDGAVVLLGALAGGLLGARIGLRETLVLASFGELVAAFWLWRSPVGVLRELPEG